MPIPVRQTFPTQRNDLQIQVTDDGSLTLIRTKTDDSFHSGCGAVSETRHVYLQNSGTARRLADGLPTRVLEVGLGTAMAMLMTVDAATKADCELEFHAIETDWIDVDTFNQLRPDAWVQDPSIVESYRRFRQALPDRVTAGAYHWECDPKRNVTIHVCDVLDWNAEATKRFDAIYFDPFCPASAPELWSERCFRKMHRVAESECQLTTYSCSRAVRDTLAAAGWNPMRVPGPTEGKREVLVATPK